MAIPKTYNDTASFVNSVSDEYLIVVQTSTGSDLSTMQQTNIGKVREPLAISLSSVASSLASETDRAVASEASLALSISEEINRASSSEASLTQRIEGLNLTTAGADGSYIKLVSQASGAVSVTAETFDTSVTGSTGKAPTSKAVKDYVDNKVAGITGAVGNTGVLIQKLTQTSGAITGDTINLDTDLNTAGATTGVPTSNAVKSHVSNEISKIAGAVGNAGTLIKSITQTDGKITGTPINVDTGVGVSSTGIPTSSAVKSYVDISVEEVINGIDFTGVGGTGSYIRFVEQNDAQLNASAVNFATTISTGANNENAPTSKAVKDYVDAETTRAKGVETSLSTAIANASGSAASSSASYASAASTALHNEITRASDAETALGDRINGLNYTLSVTDGYYISAITQASGAISASTTALATAATTGNKKAITSEAVRSAINALTAASVGADGKYIKTISETGGIISATTQGFDTTIGPLTGTGASTDNNAPTSLAVEKRVQALKEEILTETEAMTYEGTVDSYTGISTKAKYDKGDVYIASGNFNLYSSSSASTAYQVNNGDMLIVKDDATSYNKDNFDIIGGSDKTVLYEGSSALGGNFLAFDGASGASVSGRSIVDSGWNAQSIIDTVSDSAHYASLASTAASYAASSADFASNRVQPYVDQASCSASLAKVYETTAGVSATNASCSASSALVSKNTAGVYATAAACSASSALVSKNTAGVSATAAACSASSALVSKTSAETSAATAGVYATTAGIYATAAACSASSASDSKTSAETSATIAGNNKDAAILSAASAATANSDAWDYRSSAATANSDAWNSKSSAATALESAWDSKSSAATALESAWDSKSSAATALESAWDSKSSAADYEASASRSASVASSFAAQANLNIIAQQCQAASNGASTSASAAEVYATTAGVYATNASCSASSAASAVASAINATTTTGTGNVVTNVSGASGKVTASKGWAVTSLTAGTGNGNVITTLSLATGVITYNKGITALVAADIANKADKATTLSGYGITDAKIANGVITLGTATITPLTAHSPVATTTVAGLVSTGAQSFAGNKTFSNTVTANEFVANSSRKVKENIHPTVVSALDLIDKVAVVDFNYITDEEKKPHIGFIAEDTDPLLSTPHQKGMDYTNCIGTLIKAVQEITKGLSTLEKEIKELKK